MDSNRQNQEHVTPNDFDQFKESEIEDLYSWIDSIPLSRPKRNITRDFADGVLVAEVVKYFLPKYVELHNYAPANSVQQKTQNWQLLNKKVFSKLKFQLSEDVIKSVAMCRVGVIEKVLLMLRVKISNESYDNQHRGRGEPNQTTPPKTLNDKPEADQNINTGNVNSTGSQRGLSSSHPHPQRSNVQYKGSHQKLGGPSHDQVPRILFEEKEQENLAKEETIQILQAKIKRLEHLVHLKDVRIDDLQNRIEELRLTGHAHRK